MFFLRLPWSTTSIQVHNTRIPYRCITPLRWLIISFDLHNHDHRMAFIISWQKLEKVLETPKACIIEKHTSKSYRSKVNDRATVYSLYTRTKSLLSCDMCCVKDPFSHYNTLLWYKYDSTRHEHVIQRDPLLVHEHVITQSDLHIIFCIIRAYPSIVSTVCCTVNKYRRCYVMILYWYIIEFNSTQSNEFNNDVSSGKYKTHKLNVIEITSWC